MSDEMILSNEETGAARPVARMAVIDKETGKEIPVDVKTCARAVTCDEGKTMEEHLQTIYGHTDNPNIHMTAEEKAGMETTTGAQEKANAALQAAKNYATEKDKEVLSAAGAAADQKISTALQTAASDATTKANEAKNAAITAAAADAAAKAAAAEKAAKEASRPATWIPTAAQTGAAAIPVYVTATMSASGWSNKKYSFESTYPNASNDISIEVAPTATAAQFEAFGAAMICGSHNSNIATALGDVPTVNIPIIIKVVKK